MSLFNCYQVLGAHPGLTDDQIRMLYRAEARKHHPDRGGDQEAFYRVQFSYKEVATAADRKLLATKLQGLGSPCGACGSRGYTTKALSFTRRSVAPCDNCGSCGFIPRE